MSDLTASEIVAWLQSTNAVFSELEHQLCVTSAESYAARRSAGHLVVGAKALVLQLTCADGDIRLGLAVLRGDDRLRSSSLRKVLRESFGLKAQVSFATPHVLRSQLRGLEPGRVPPFGAPLLPAVTIGVVDSALLAEHQIGFNAADFRRSIVLGIEDYLRLVPTFAVDCIALPQGTREPS